MANNPPQSPFNYELLRTLIGIIAISIALICIGSFYYVTELSIFVPGTNNTEIFLPTSISVTYHFGAQTPFVGMLFIVGAFLFSYGGSSTLQFYLAKAAAVFAFLVAIFPTSINMNWVKRITELENTLPRKCLTQTEICYVYDFFLTARVHQVAAILLIMILFAFCLIFLFRVRSKITRHPSHPKLKARAAIYAICALSMIGAGIYFLVSADSSNPADPALFYVEFICLLAFRISWLVAGKKITILAEDKDKEGSMTDELVIVKPMNNAK